MKIFPTEFDGKATRRVYDEATETWWFSVLDVPAKRCQGVAQSQS